MALPCDQLEADVHLAFDCRALARRCAGAARDFHLLRAHAHPEEALIPQADRSGLATGGRNRAGE
jgi:hypothetical protein